LDRLEALVRARGLIVFARIEFTRDAVSAGLTLPPMAQLVFGDPRAGTPVMAVAPAMGLALPLRALAWEDAEGHSWLSYEAPEFIGERFSVPKALVANVAGIRALCEAAVAADSAGLPAQGNTAVEAKPSDGQSLRNLLVALIGVPLVIAMAAVALRWDRSPPPTENRVAMSTMVAGMDIKPSGDEDRDFVAMMVPHHRGAIDMAQVELRDGHNEQLRRIAQEIIVTQQQEIAAMRVGLGQIAPMSHYSATR
jgi:uncharacterized protein (DUF302 family)